MADVQQPGEGPPISPHDRIQYEQEYIRGCDLFQRALAAYNDCNEIHKKEAFKEVMDQAMQVLNQTAFELRRSDLKKKNEEITQSLQSLDNPQEPTKLDHELKEARKSV